MLLDLIRPTSGRAAIFGLDTIAQSVAIRQRIGFSPAKNSTWDRLTAREIVNLHGQFTRRGAYRLRQ
ncbi:hypothetical protein [Candidatus Flexifilum breve]|uniref:hypothetical protein n=1 Tax=Candidatus Flexifilum breve TaxID=3140694 RepID=UPI003313049E